MNKHIHRIPAVTPFPIESVRALVEKHQMEDSQWLTQIPPPDRTLPSKAFIAYDGSVDFDHWLNLPTTTRSQTREVQKRLYLPWLKAMHYLQEIGLPEEDEICGKMAGKIVAMIPISILREMYLKHANDQYQNEEELNHDCYKIFAFLKPKYHLCRFTEEMKQMMKQCHDFYSLSDLLISKYNTVADLTMIRHIYIIQLQKLFANEMTNFFYNRNKSLPFLTAFCIGFLSKTHLLNIHNEYWTEKNCQERLMHICTFYQRIARVDNPFVQQHFPRTITHFLRKKEITPESLYSLYIKRIIYTSALQQKPLDTLLKELLKYEIDYQIQIELPLSLFKDMYYDANFRNFNWANAGLDTILHIIIL